MCLVIGLLLIVSATAVLLTKRKLRYAITCVLLALSSIALYTPYLSQKYNAPSAMLSSLFNVVQMIFVNADFFGVCDAVGGQLNTVFLEDVYICALSVVHIALPIVAILTAYNIIAYYMAKTKLRVIDFTNHDVFVFSACTQKAELLARDINKEYKKNKKKANFVFAGKGIQDDIDSNISNSLNCIFYDEEITKVKIKLKKNRKVYYFNMSANEDKNLNNSLALIEAYAPKEEPAKKKRSAKPNLQRNASIVAFLENNESDILFDASNKGNMNIRIVDEDQTAAYELLDTKPLYINAKNNAISLLIVGFDNGGEELLKAAVWCGQLGDISLEINIVTDNVKQKKEKLLFKYPQMLHEDYNIKFHEAALDEASLAKVLTDYCMDTTYIAVANGSDEENLRLAIYLRSFFLRSDPDFKNTPFIAARIKSIEKYKAIETITAPVYVTEEKMGYDIYPYGNDGDIYSYKELVDAPLEKLAMNVHCTYAEITNEGGAFDKDKVLAEYNVLEVKKRASIANAMHIKYKLWLMGLEYTDDNAKRDKAVDFSDYLDAETLHKLADMEHDRWMAHVRTEGWTSASIDEAKSYQDISKKRHDCPIAKMHPYICAFGELEARASALGKSDPTKNDMGLVRYIPAILGDKWGATDKRYTIVKRAEEN